MSQSGLLVIQPELLKVKANIRGNPIQAGVRPGLCRPAQLLPGPKSSDFTHRIANIDLHGQIAHADKNVRWLIPPTQYTTSHTGSDCMSLAKFTAY